MVFKVLPPAPAFLSSLPFPGHLRPTCVAKPAQGVFLAASPAGPAHLRLGLPLPQWIVHTPPVLGSSFGGDSHLSIFTFPWETGESRQQQLPCRRGSKVKMRRDFPSTPKKISRVVQTASPVLRCPGWSCLGSRRASLPVSTAAH